MSRLAPKLETAVQPGQLVWLHLDSPASSDSDGSKHANQVVSTQIASLDLLQSMQCHSMNALCKAIDSQTALLVVPAPAMTPAGQLQLRDALMAKLERTDLPLLVITQDSHAAPDLGPLSGICTPISLPATAIPMSLPGMELMAFESHRLHSRLHDDSDASESLERRLQRDEIFQTLLKILPVGIAIAHDVECTRMTMNPAAAQLLDIPLNINPSKTGPDQNHLDFTCIDDGQVVAPQDRPMQYAARTGKSVMGRELLIIRGDGTKLNIVIYAVPLFDPQGKTCGCAGVLVDITTQKKVQNELLKTKARLSLAQQCAKAGVWEWNIHTDEVIWSDEMYRLTGKPADFDPSNNNWNQVVHPDDLENVVATLKSHKEFQMEFRVIREHGELQWMLSSGQLILDDNGRPARLLGICIDITDYKIAESSLRENAVRFHTMMDASPLGIFITDAQGGYQYTNAVLQRITHLSGDELIQTGLIELVHPEDKEHVKAAWDEALTRHQRFEQICRLRLPDQQYAWIHLRAAPVIDDGQLSGYIGKVEDITRQRRAQAALRLSQEHLQKANDTLAQRNEDMEEMLSITAHDLKHPVVGIQGLLSLLKEDCYAKLDEENKLNLDLSLGECERMKEMLTRLSELGRIEQTRPRMGIASLRDVVDTCVKRYQSLCQQNNITMKVDVPEKQVRLPKAILEEVLSNLIDNAIKYGCPTKNMTEQSSIEYVIEISAICEPVTCTISVKDNGQGIDPQHHERIFRPFRRLVAKNGQAGSGLGLTAVKRLIQRIGGQVRVTSALNEGATFEMQFPIEDEKPCPTQETGSESCES